MSTATQQQQTTTLDEARLLFHAELQMQGQTTCPVCEQRAGIYRRTINKGMVDALVDIYQAAGRRTGVQVHGPSVISDLRSNEHGKLTHWGLLEQGDLGRGYWSVTPKGERFVRGETRVRSTIVLYNNKVIERTGDLVGISDALGTPFNLDEVLGR